MFRLLPIFWPEKKKKEVGFSEEPAHVLCHLCGASESVTICHLDIVSTAHTRNPEVLRITQSRLLLFFADASTKLSPPSTRWPIPCTPAPQAQPNQHGGGGTEGGAPARPEGELQCCREWKPRAAPLQPHGQQRPQPQQGRDPRAAEGQHEHPCELGAAGGMAAGPPPARGPACRCQLGHISRTPSSPSAPGPQTTAQGSVTSFWSFTRHTCIECALCLSLYSILVYKLGFSVQKNFSVLST